MCTGAVVQLPVFDGGAGRGVSGDACCSHSFAHQAARRGYQVDMSGLLILGNVFLHVMSRSRQHAKSSNCPMYAVPAHASQPIHSTVFLGPYTHVCIVDICRRFLPNTVATTHHCQYYTCTVASHGRYGNSPVESALDSVQYSTPKTQTA